MLSTSDSQKPLPPPPLVGESARSGNTQTNITIDNANTVARGVGSNETSGDTVAIEMRDVVATVQKDQHNGGLPRVSVGLPPTKETSSHDNQNTSQMTRGLTVISTPLALSTAARFPMSGHHQTAASPSAATAFVVQGVPLYATEDFQGGGGSNNSSTTESSGRNGGASYGSPSSSSSSKFVVQGYKDVWAAVVFLGFTFLVFVIGAYNMSNYFDSDEFEMIVEGERLDGEKDNDDDHDEAKKSAKGSDSGLILKGSMNVFAPASDDNQVRAPAVTTTVAYIASSSSAEGEPTPKENKKKKSKKEVDPNLEGLRRFGRRCILAGVLGALAGVVLGIGSIGVFYLAPSISIVASNAIVIAILFFLSFYFFMINAAFVGVIVGIVGAFRCYVLYKYRSQIPLSGLLLRQSTILAKRYPAAIAFGFLTFSFAVAWALFAFAAAFPSYRKLWIGVGTAPHDDDNHGIAFSSVGLVFFLMCFGIYWSSQISFYLGHVAFSGVAATWYFFGDNNMPRNPTLHSARRALTTSFGSVCLGSIFASMVRTLQSFLPVTSSASDNRQRFCSSVCMCLTSFIRAAVDLFSHFSFTFVAMYGCGFVEGAKRSGQLVRNSPYQPIFGNLLLEGTLGTFQTVIGFAVGVIAFYVSVGVERAEADRERANAVLLNPSQPRNGNDDAYRDFPELLAFILAYLAGIAAVVVLTQVFRFVDSTVTTLLVCLSEEPQRIFETNSDFGEQIASFAALESRQANDNDDNETPQVRPV